MAINSTSSTLLALFLISVLWLPSVLARERAFIQGTGIDGQERSLDVSRYPALYTSDFGDCLGSGDSLFNITKFDAAYYADNRTVLFHLDGTSNVRSENLILHISMEVYGENRFNMTYDPCKGDIGSLCPLRATQPVEAFAVIPISPDDVAGIPSIALGIPDVEGFATLRVFANSTETEIGCFQAALTNGQTFAQPQSVGAALGGLSLLAMVASFATATYGLSIKHMRMHYAHSVSVLVVLETFQSIFFTGMLSVDWPSVLPAWWSNFAWSAGMFANDHLVQVISSFTGNAGNTSQVGNAGSTTINNEGGLRQSIYGKANLAPVSLPSVMLERASVLTRGPAFNASDPYDYDWSGHPRTPGMPMPGTWPGFGGTLSSVDIPFEEAFIIGLIWLLVILSGIAVLNISAKLVIEALLKLRLVKSDGFNYFRSHWLGYLTAGLLRSMFVAFPAVITMSLYQLSLHGPAAPTVIAALLVVTFLFGIGGLAVFACWSRLRHGKFETGSDQVRFERAKVFNKIPFVTATRVSTIGEEERAEKPRLYGAVPFVRVQYVDDDPNRATIHQDEGFIKRFGWLSARYRRTRWWFFTIYLGYQLVRACFLGGGSQTPLAQVFGLFVFEILAFLAIIKLNPFESNRNTVASVWMLSLSKIITTGIAIAFLPGFQVNRTVTTVLGLIIMVVQGFLTVAIAVLVIISIVSSWMSLSRNRENFPMKLNGSRVKYFEHMEKRSRDLPKSKHQPRAEAEGVSSSFNVRDVRRTPKMEDGQAARSAAQFPNLTDVPEEDESSAAAVPRVSMEQIAAINRRNRAHSMTSRTSIGSLPRTAREHRKSWSASDFAQWDAESSRPQSRRMSHKRHNSLRMQVMAASLGSSSPRLSSEMTSIRPMSAQELAMAPELTNAAVLGGETRTKAAEAGHINAGHQDDNSPAEEASATMPASFVAAPVTKDEETSTDSVGKRSAKAPSANPNITSQGNVPTA